MTANEVLAGVRDDHNWKQDQIDLSSTSGIQRAIMAQWHAIEALADYIDGVATGETDNDGKPIKSSEAGKSNGVSPRDGRRDQAKSASAA